MAFSRSLLAAATTIAAGGLIAGTAPAQAFPQVPLAPTCGQWGFPGATTLQLSSGEFVTFNSTGPNAGGSGQWNTTNGSPPHQGTVSGGINTGGAVSVAFHDQKGRTDTFAGQVNPDGNASGNISGGPADLTWSSATPMKCAAAEAPTNKVTVSFNIGIPTTTVNVKNDAEIGGNCTYKATSNNGTPGANKSFTIAPNGTASFTVISPLLLTVYHTVTSCIGTFNGQSVEFGHDEQDVTFSG
ncbi:MAG TPA: hypothetical protein VH496_07590 [Mycobacterium sp.]|jgi:hypothetical protein